MAFSFLVTPCPFLWAYMHFVRRTVKSRILRALRLHRDADGEGSQYAERDWRACLPCIIYTPRADLDFDFGLQTLRMPERCHR